MNIDSNQNEQLQRLQIDLLLPSFAAITPHPVELCRRMLAMVPQGQSSILAVASLILQSGLTYEAAVQAKWSHVVLEEGVIWDPQQLAWRPLYGAHSWLGYVWNRGANGQISDGLVGRMAMLK